MLRERSLHARASTVGLTGRARRPRRESPALGLQSEIANPVWISIVIPVYRDEAAFARTLARVLPASDVEIVAASTPEERDALAPLRNAHPDVVWVEAPRGRARQMNAGAAAARGEWLIFLHADTALPDGWRSAIEAAACNPQVTIGCFRFALDSSSPAARVIEQGVALRVRLLKLPYGDQALFLRRSLFADLGGYADEPIMEDVDLVRRATRRGRLYASGLPATTSSRLWEQRGWVGTTARHLGLMSLYACGVRPTVLARLARSRHL